MSAAGPVRDTAYSAISDPAAFGAGVPHAVFAQLRQQAEACWVEEVGLLRHSGSESVLRRGTGFWAVTRYSTVEAVSKAPELFSSAARGSFLNDPVSRADLLRARELLVNMDAPRHTRLRRIVTGAFTPKAISQLRASIVAHAEVIVERITTADGFDAVADVAAELPLLVLADLLGIPRSDRSLLFQWSNNLVGFDDPEYGGGSVTRFRDTFTEAFQYALEAGAQRRRSPREDLLSRLVSAEVDGRRLTEHEFCQLWILLVVAGNETTRHLISGAFAALGERPDERARLAADPGLVAPAVDELLRWVTPIMQFRRTATRDTELGGQRISEGDKVVLYYISANRDERVFTDPDRLDIGRNPNPQIAFGTGPHFCLGSHLARLELATLLELLLEHLPRYEITGPPRRLESNFMNGLKSLPSRFRKPS